MEEIQAGTEPKFQVGQKVFVVYNQKCHGQNTIAEITKIGRQWIYFKVYSRESRFDKDTLRIDGGVYSSPGRVYMSEAVYKNEQEKLSLIYLIKGSSRFSNFSLEELKLLWDKLEQKE